MTMQMGRHHMRDTAQGAAILRPVGAQFTGTAAHMCIFRAHVNAECISI